MANIDIFKTRTFDDRIINTVRDIGYHPGGYYRMALSGVVASKLPAHIPLWTDPDGEVYGIPLSKINMAIFSVEGGTVRWRDDFLPMSVSSTVTSTITNNPLAIGGTSITIAANVGFAIGDVVVLSDGANTEFLTLTDVAVNGLTLTVGAAVVLAAHASGVVISKLIEPDAGTSLLTPLQMTTQLSASTGGLLQVSGDIVSYVGNPQTLRFILASGSPIIHFSLYR